ncbi:hypothetical protein GGF42_003331 [Coemansia sp. RSA 2424]|nr:hypothetical protein GGF42_003331 [Coemansia sp. RSA 2424]
MLFGSKVTAAIAGLVPLASAQLGMVGSGYGSMGYGGMGYGGVGYGGMGYGGMGYGTMGYGGMGYAGAGYAGVGYSGMGYTGTGYTGTGYYGANMGSISPWAYGNAGGYTPTGFGHGIIQGASTSGAIIQGPSGTIIAPPQSAGSIVF